jgi:hypothetical protein
LIGGAGGRGGRAGSLGSEFPFIPSAIFSIAGDGGDGGFGGLSAASAAAAPALLPSVSPKAASAGMAARVICSAAQVDWAAVRSASYRRPAAQAAQAPPVS